ncbi:MAG: DUF971 domain-containing protein [Cryobacterium sp.]|nr:DUF971 domain-containing protein [Oligoflexia bacterium]
MNPTATPAPMTNFDKTTIPSRVEPHSPTEMLFAWSNGETYAVPYFELRFICPCAHCVDEHTGKRTLKRENVQPDVRAVGVQAVGRYALQISWSDKHSTGMYPFDLLYGTCARHGLRIG